MMPLYRIYPSAALHLAAVIGDLIRQDELSRPHLTVQLKMAAHESLELSSYLSGCQLRVNAQHPQTADTLSYQVESFGARHQNRLPLVIVPAQSFRLL